MGDHGHQDFRNPIVTYTRGETSYRKPRTVAWETSGQTEVLPHGLYDTTVPVMIDETPQMAKPSKDEAGRITRRIGKPESLHDVTVTELALSLSYGFTVCPGVCKGGRKDSNWISQRLWFIDVDNDAEMLRYGRGPLGEREAAERARLFELPLVFSYQTFSGTDMDEPLETQRFRLVFMRANETHERAEAERFGKALLAAYPEADPTTIQLTRLFYGTDKGVNVWA